MLMSQLRPPQLSEIVEVAAAVFTWPAPPRLGAGSAGIRVQEVSGPDVKCAGRGMGRFRKKWHQVWPSGMGRCIHLTCTFRYHINPPPLA